MECHVFLLDWAVRDRRMKSDGRRKREVEEEERQRNIKKPSEGRGKERRDTNVLIRRQNQAGLGGGGGSPFPPRALMTPPLSPHFWILYTLCAFIPLSEALRIAHYCDSHVEFPVEVRV